MSAKSPQIATNKTPRSSNQKAANGMRKNRKGGALRPRLPVRCRASRPFGTIGRRPPRPFGLLITRSASMVSHKSGGVIGPGPCFTSRCYDADPVLAGRGTNQRRNLRRKVPCRLRLTVLRQNRQTVALRTYRSPPPSAAHGSERPWACLPCELSACFPAPPDFSTDTFHNRSPHD